MGFKTCGLSVNTEGKEMQEHGSFGFPCAAYRAVYTNSRENIIPWHWHEEIEIVCLKTGSMVFCIPGRECLLHAGDCLMINSNVPHYAAAKEKSELHSLVFHPLLITGSNLSAIARKYITPLISCGTGSFLFEDGELKQVKKCFYKAFEAIGTERAGFEFEARNSLSDICFFLYQKNKKTVEPESGESPDTARIRAMLDYIHRNFAQEIRLTDVAKAASIGNRECLRCFQRAIQLSPMQYLMRYRLSKSAELLEHDAKISISETANVCGFESPSNFSKLFRRNYGLSPREYRMKKQAAIQTACGS
ncbi:MAG: AraC family transcriptional regulator [Eubacteriales bacterium]|nr:AraC family transcriptional regulator [Eubacteriales bacterium]